MTVGGGMILVAVVVAVVLADSVNNASPTYNLCVLPRTPMYNAEQICDKLGPTPVRCVMAVDRLECMKKINTGEADFAVFEAEDVLIAADVKHLSNILITHKIHTSNEHQWEYGVVALVSNKAKISSLSDLKGRRLCHPGYDPMAANYDWSEVFSLYFENRIAPQICDKDLSIEENRIKVLANFFGESCKPGVWATDPKIDAELKKKYKSMCGLCDVPSVCSQRDKYWGRQGALYCLSDCLGDVAWSMLKDAKLHFSSAGVSVCEDVSLLCRDGSTMPLNSTNPCVWVTRPVPVIAAKRTKAEEIQRMLREVTKMPDTPNDFLRLLESNIMHQPVEVSPSITPTDYLTTAPGYLSANSMTACGQESRAVAICVSTLEDKNKCEWLATVSRVYGLQPSLSCIYGANCLVSVANRSADVTIASTDKLLPASRDYNLKPLLVQLPVQLKQVKTVSAVVKSESDIKTLSDLKGKKACFPTVDGMERQRRPEFPDGKLMYGTELYEPGGLVMSDGGRGSLPATAASPTLLDHHSTRWTSFTMAMKNNDKFSGVCPYNKSISNFFSEICISEPSPAAAEYPNIKICSTDYILELHERGEVEDISFDEEAIAFHCLINGGDVAFISASMIPSFLEQIKNYPEAEGFTADSFRVVCKDSTSKRDCHLSWASHSQVLVHSKMTPSREEDVRSLFTGLNSLFGYQNSPSTRTFNMFASQNSLFHDKEALESTQQQLVDINDFLKKAKLRPKNYESSTKTNEKCSPSSASQLYVYYSTIVFAFLITLNIL